MTSILSSEVSMKITTLVLLSLVFTFAGVQLLLSIDSQVTPVDCGYESTLSVTYPQTSAGYTIQYLCGDYQQFLEVCLDQCDGVFASNTDAINRFLQLWGTYHGYSDVLPLPPPTTP